jgi:glucosylceramidase
MAGGSPTFSVDEASTQQEWLGFGGTFNEAGWDALQVLDAAERDRAIKLLFSRNEGANFTWGRFPIGASDYALDRYSLSETADDFTMENFSIVRDKELLIPYIQAALTVKPGIRLWASPWSPPAWMKTNNDMNSGRIKDDPLVLQAYALYFARFVEAYEAEGLDIEQIMPQNEPGYETNYPSCLWTPELLRDFVRDYLGPTFAERRVGAEIWFGTMSAPEDTSHISSVMADASAAQFVRGFGLQWNTMGSTGMLASQYGLPVMQTEHKCGNYRFMPETYNSERPPNDHAYGEESWGLIRDWIKAGVSSYSAWNMVLDTQGSNLDGWLQNSLLTVDRNSNTLNETPAYYVFRHLSYFVDAGAIRVGTSGDTDALAFKNPDGGIATVIFNSQSSAQQMSLGVGGTTLQFEVPARGWASVYWAP